MLNDLVAIRDKRPMTHPKLAILKLADNWEDRSKVAQ